MTKNLNLRLGDSLHSELKAAAKEDRRSLNSEIEALLELALSARQVQVRRARWPEGVPEEELGQYLSTFDLPPLRGENDPD